MSSVPENVSVIITRVNGETHQTKINTTQKTDRIYLIGLLTEAIGILQAQNYEWLGGSAELDAAEEP